MADDFTILNPGVGGDTMDETSVTYGTAPFTRKRPRVILSGEGLGEIVPALNTKPDGDEYGIVTRPILSYPGIEITEFDLVTLVPTNVETTITTYTVPSGKTLNFTGFVASGNANALYKLYVATDTIFASRTSVSNLTYSLLFATPPFQVGQGVTIVLKVIHQAGVACDFEGTILGYIV
jgi:hypothetical protein